MIYLSMNPPMSPIYNTLMLQMYIPLYMHLYVPLYSALYHSDISKMATNVYVLI